MNEQIDSEELELARHATVMGLIKHAFVPVITTLLASLYMVADGVFISNLTSSSEYAGTIIAAPYITCFSSIGFMIGGGGNAYVGRLFGEGKKERAVEVFSMLIEVTVIITVLASFIGFIFLKPFLISQGASGDLLEHAYEYGQILFVGTIFLALQYEFQLFMITSGDEVRAFIYTLLAGIVNIVLDAVFMMALHSGNEGAAVATVIGEFVGAVAPFIFYVRCKNKEGAMLFFKWTKLEMRVIWDVCVNGMSEMIETVAESVLGFFFNYQLLKSVGEMGVNAYGSIMYVFMIYSLTFVGFNEAIVPMMAYQYGAKKKKELGDIVSRGLIIICGMSVIFFAITEIFASPLSNIFNEVGDETYKMSVHGFRICGISLLFMGAAMFVPSLYTALGNGLVSGIITLLEVLVFPAILVSILPTIWGIDGVWRSVYSAWGISIVMCIAFIIILRTDRELTV